MAFGRNRPRSVAQPINPARSIDTEVTDGIIAQNINDVSTNAEAPVESNVQPITAAQESGSQLNSTQGQVDSNSTSIGQVNNILSKDSPFLKRAKTRAMQAANSRGLINSSIAAGAGEAAAIDASKDFAMHDASVYERQANKNQDFSQRTDEFNVTQSNDANQRNADRDNRANEFNSTLESGVNQRNADRATDVSKSNINSGLDKAKIIQQEVLARLDNENANVLATLNKQYERIIYNDKNSSEAYQNAIQGISNVLANKDMTPEQQEEAAKTITTMLSKFLEFNEALTQSGQAQL